MLTKNLLIIASFFVAGCSTVATNPPVAATKSGNVTNYETAGNLQSSNPVGCVPVSALSRAYTPADLLIGANKCAVKADYETAVALYSVAGVYGTFDKLRVRDQSAHEALQVLRMNFANSLNSQQKAAFGQTIRHTFSDASAHDSLCASLKSLGPPNYFPTYMVQHGMNAFTGGTSGGELQPNFNASQAWSKALDMAAHCKVGT